MKAFAGVFGPPYMTMVPQRRTALSRAASLARACAVCLLVLHLGATSAVFAKGSHMGRQQRERISGTIDLACSNQVPVRLTLRIVEGQNVFTYEIRLRPDYLERAKATVVDDGDLTITRTVNTKGVDRTESVGGRLRILNLDTQGAGIAKVAFASGDSGLNDYFVYIKDRDCSHGVNN